jgi:hypothetical protein
VQQLPQRSRVSRKQHQFDYKPATTDKNFESRSISYSWSKFRDALIMGNKEEAVRVWCTSSKQDELSGRALN